MSKTFGALILDYWYKLPIEAQQMMQEAYETGPLGQTQNSSGVYYYGTRGTLTVSTASVAAAALVGGFEFAFLGNESVMEMNVLSKGNVFKVISRPGQWGFRIDPAHHAKPWEHTEFWRW